MKVDQAIVCAAGTGSRLGLGVKSLIIYKDRLLVDYLLTAILQTGINRIVVNAPAKSHYRNISDNSLTELGRLINKYPEINFVEDDHQSFGRRPDYLRKYLDTTKPFFIFCGQSPQLPSHIKAMSEVYEEGGLVTSGYKYRCDNIIPIAKTAGNRVKGIKVKNFSEPTAINVNLKNQTIPHYPMILDYNFYDDYPKKDNFKFRMYNYLNDFIQQGGDVINIDNPITISEVDYPVDLERLFKSINQIIPTL